MPKDIKIQQDGTESTLLGIFRIRTRTGDGTCYWVPKSDTRQSSLTVTENGTYEASGENLHSFDKVIVKVYGWSDSVTGTRGGKTYTVTKNSSGRLVYTEVSS